MDLPPLKKFEGKDINIMDAKMFLSDSNMLLMDSFHPSSAYRYDLSKGKIVEEWVYINLSTHLFTYKNAQIYLFFRIVETRTLLIFAWRKS